MPIYIPIYIHIVWNPKIHFFNPGHETAIFTRLWKLHSACKRAEDDQVVILSSRLVCRPGGFCFYRRDRFTSFLLLTTEGVQAVCQANLTQGNRKAEGQPARNASNPLGTFPHSHSLFEKLRKSGNLNLTIPEWKEYTWLTSRQTAAECLDKIRELLPDMDVPVSPKFCKKVREVEKYLILQNAPFILKTPYSSSGRGLLWLPERKLTTKDRTWIEGALNKQGCQHRMCTDKYQDFAMGILFRRKREHTLWRAFRIRSWKERSLFRKCIGRTDISGKLLCWKLRDKFQQLKETVGEAIRQIYGNIYTGYLGVDMLVYRKSKRRIRRYIPAGWTCATQWGW